MIKLRSRILWTIPTLYLALAACGSEAPRLDEQPPAGRESVSPAGEGPLHIELFPLAAGTGSVEYQVTNDGAEPVRFLPRETALNGVYSNLFEVRRDDKAVPYVGPGIVFAPPRAEDYVELAPGESLTKTLDLSALYALREAGEYSVRPRLSRPALLPARGLAGPGVQPRALITLEEAPLTVSVDERHVTPPEPVPVLEKTRQECLEVCEEGCTFNVDPAQIGLCQSVCPATCDSINNVVRPTCSTNEDSTLATASALARQLMSSGIPGVDSGNAYLTWFGVRTNARTFRVRNVLASASNDVDPTLQICLNAGDAMFAGDSTGGCRGPGITNQFLAGTNGSLGRNVAYCPDFFAQGARDRAATVVHEAVHHFGVEDISAFFDSDGDGVREEVLVNSPGAAQGLANADPDAATVSAVNYQNYALEF